MGGSASGVIRREASIGTSERRTKQIPIKAEILPVRRRRAVFAVAPLRLTGAPLLGALNRNRLTESATERRSLEASKPANRQGPERKLHPDRAPADVRGRPALFDRPVGPLIPTL